MTGTLVIPAMLSLLSADLWVSGAAGRLCSAARGSGVGSAGVDSVGASDQGDERDHG